MAKARLYDTVLCLRAPCAFALGYYKKPTTAQFDSLRLSTSSLDRAKTPFLSHRAPLFRISYEPATLLRLTPRPLPYSHGLRGRLRGLLLLLGFGRCLGRAGILGRPSSSLFVSVGFGGLLFLLLWRGFLLLLLLLFRFFLFLRRSGCALGSPP